MTQIGLVDNPENRSRPEAALRSVDLNLIIVFDAVMQEQNITRAAQTLGMSQPAVSNAVSRLKQMFNDELFVRNGRGIKPTQRARQLFGPLRQAIQLIKNELPTSVFVPETSNRTFRLVIGAPSDLRFAPEIISQIQAAAPNVRVVIETGVDKDLARHLRYQEVDFVIDYVNFNEAGFSSTEMFSDEVVVIASKNHPRVQNELTAKTFQQEAHAVLKRSKEHYCLVNELYSAGRYQESYNSSSLINMLYVVSQSELVAVVPAWMVNACNYQDKLNTFKIPSENGQVSGYLSWHESAEKDKGHIWMRDQLLSICGNTLV